MRSKKKSKKDNVSQVDDKQEMKVEDLPVADPKTDQVKAGASGASGGVWKTTNF